MWYVLARIGIGVVVVVLVGTGLGSVYAVLDYIGFFAGDEDTN